MSLSIIGYCQSPGKTEQARSVSGTVVDTDWVGNKLVVRALDNDDMTFVVSNDTKITKGAHDIDFSEIGLSDAVKVYYYANSFAGLKAAEITVEE